MIISCVRAHSRAALRRVRGLSTVNVSPRSSAPFERTTNVLFLRGPYHSSWAWASLMERLGGAGFSCSALTSSVAAPLGSIEDEVKLAALIAGQGPPPLLVAHGAGGFVAQKFLESFAAAGLVLVAPFPPVPRACALRLQRPTVQPSGLSSRCGEVEFEPSPNDLVGDCLKAENILNLEPVGNFMEVLTVSTMADPVVRHEDIANLRAWHQLGQDGDNRACAPGAGGHLTMIDPCWEEQGGLADQIAEWVERQF